MSRGNGRQPVFFCDSNRERFLRQLRDNLITYDVVLYAFVLMENHYHLLVQTRKANLARFMQRLNSSYALYLHYKRHWCGHVLQGRYRAKLVEDDEYLLPLSRYVHLNPLRTAAARKLAKEERLRALADHRWSSYRAYAYGATGNEEWIFRGLLKHFGADEAAAASHDRAYVEACLAEDDKILFDALRGSRYAIGSPAYVKKIEDLLQKKRTGRPQDRDVALPRAVTDLDSIDQVVAEAYALDPAVLRRHGRRAGVAKAMAMELACRLTELNQRQIGAHYGGVTSMAVCMARRRFREGAQSAASLRARFAELEAVVLAQRK
jgi:putative transposase